MYKNKNIRTVYLDGAANTPLDKEVFKAMKPYLVGFKGNSNAVHDYGIRAFKAVEEARENILKNLGDAHHRFNLYFTSGSTESNNWVIQSTAFKLLADREKTGLDKRYIICSSIEHASIINTCKALEKLGIAVEYIKPDARGCISPKKIEELIFHNLSLNSSLPVLICVGAVNNETGAINEINTICQVGHRYHTKVLVDCTQAMSCGGSSSKICKKYFLADYLTFSSHKLYGPTGVGGLLKKKNISLPAFVHGGNQEDQSRGGTHNVAGIVGMDKAISILTSGPDYSNLYTQLGKYLMDGLKVLSKKYCVNILPVCEKHYPTIINLFLSQAVHFEQIANNLATLGVAVSAGSACSNNDSGVTHSHVLLAMGYRPNEIGNFFRVSFTKETTTKDIDQLIKALDIVLEQYCETKNKKEKTKNEN